VEVTTFKQGNCYIFGTLLFVISVIKKGTVNWVEWFKVQLHKEMITIQRKAKKVGNNLVGPTFTLVTKYYATLEYTKEDEEELIVHLQRPKKTRKRTL
jgi:hypothetical protein